MQISTEINRPLNISAIEDKEMIMTLRTSPQVNKMHRLTDRDGTIWAFEDKEQMKEFKRLSRGTKAKRRHFLSDREILSGWLGNSIE